MANENLPHPDRRTDILSQPIIATVCKRYSLRRGGSRLNLRTVYARVCIAGTPLFLPFLTKTNNVRLASRSRSNLQGVDLGRIHYLVHSEAISLQNFA